MPCIKATILLDEMLRQKCQWILEVDGLGGVIEPPENSGPALYIDQLECSHLQSVTVDPICSQPLLAAASTALRK